MTERIYRVNACDVLIQRFAYHVHFQMELDQPPASLKNGFKSLVNAEKAAKALVRDGCAVAWIEQPIPLDAFVREDSVVELGGEIVDEEETAVVD